jgi:hypothetical protein
VRAAQSIAKLAEVIKRNPRCSKKRVVTPNRDLAIEERAADRCRQTDGGCVRGADLGRIVERLQADSCLVYGMVTELYTPCRTRFA